MAGSADFYFWPQVTADVNIPTAADMEQKEIIGFHHEVRVRCELSWPRGSGVLCGVDEAGRGPLAGPVLAAAVAFPDQWIEDCPSAMRELFSTLDDSKKLTAPRREKLFSQLTSCREIRFGIGVSEPGEIDRVNILGATRTAMKRAVEALAHDPVFALVDGLPLRPAPFEHCALVRGDARSYSIAAASVIAKVTRDRIMVEADSKFPGYGFASHKGYGTRAHLEALASLGPSPIHRRSFAPVRATQMELFG